MFVLAIWLFLAGYTIAITGKRNLGLSYQPQADGSIKAVDGSGNAAKAFSLLDVVQCADASQSLNTQPAPLGAAGTSRPAGTPQPQPNPIPQLGPLPLPNPLPVPAIQLPGLPRQPVVPPPNPIPGLLEQLLQGERAIEQDVYGGLNRLGAALRGAASRIHLPGLQLPGVRPLW